MLNADKRQRRVPAVRWVGSTDIDAIPRGNVWFRIEYHGVRRIGADGFELTPVDEDPGPVRKDLDRTLAAIDHELDARRHMHLIGRVSDRQAIRIVGIGGGEIGIVVRQDVGAARPIGTARRRPGRGIGAAGIELDVATRHTGRDDAGREPVRVRVGRAGAPGRQEHGHDDAEAKLPRVARQDLGGRRWRLQPVTYV